MADQGPLNGFMVLCDVRDATNIHIRLAGPWAFCVGTLSLSVSPASTSSTVVCCFGSKEKMQRRYKRQATSDWQEERILIAGHCRSGGRRT